ncbi:unnamed protein product, partial [Adineta steineri]
MHRCVLKNLCTTSISSSCDHKCDQKNHVPPNIPIYDGHIHLNQNVFKIHSDFVSTKTTPPIRDFYFINNYHKPNEWLTPITSLSLPHVHIYHTLGIHPKYFDPNFLHQILNNLKSRLEVSHLHSNSKDKIVAIGECGLDVTSTISLQQQLFAFEKQIDLATSFHIPLVLHCRGTHLYKKMYESLKSRIEHRNLSIHWHCINSHSDLHVVDLFLNTFPNAYIGINGSITYETNSNNSIMFQKWLIDRSTYLPDRIILETDYPHLSPKNLHGVYDPSCAIFGTALYLSEIIHSSDQHALAYLHASNTNIKLMYR